MKTIQAYLQQQDTSSNSLGDQLRKYYRKQSVWYDLTRWAFLFGRKRLIRMLPLNRKEILHFIEPGCGTGVNLAQIRERYPYATVHGIDLSEDMLQSAYHRLQHLRRVRLTHGFYGQQGLTQPDSVHAVVCSYMLTMVNPGFEQIIDKAYADLKPGGIFAVVDFHTTRHPWFARWMWHNHVRMEGQWLKKAETRFVTHTLEYRKAYLGWWTYAIYIGVKP